MAPLLNAKAWFKRRRNKTRNVPKTDVYVPGIGYPPMRNSSQPTLIPYVPPTGSSSSSISSGNDEGPESSLETVTQDLGITATVSILGNSQLPTTLIVTPDTVNPGANNDYHDDYCRRYQENNQSSATLVSPDRHTSLQPPKKPFAIALSAQHRNGSHASLPALLPGELLSDLRKSPGIGPTQTGNRNCESPQPQKPLNAMKNSKFAASTDSLSMSESKAQEYARTVKTVWQMIEDKDLAHRLADCTPVEREWLILNHKNANFPFKPTIIPPENHENRAIVENVRARPGVRGGALARIDETEQHESPRPDNKQHRYAQPAIVSLPNSPVTGPVDSSDPKKERRSTLLSPMVLHSARELQKRDHITIQQRVDMEESWRLQARVTRSQGEHEDRARGVRKVHEQLIQRQMKQRNFKEVEYQPTHKDFNKWFDLKEEVDNNSVPDLNDDIRGFDLKEEYEDEEEKKQRELEEKEANKRKELEDFEQEMDVLGLDRFDGCTSFVESDEARVPRSPQQTEPFPEDLLAQKQKQQELHQQLQYQYQQLQLQLEMQRQTVRIKRNRRRKALAAAAAAGLGPVSVPNILPPPTSAVPEIPKEKPASKLIVLPTAAQMVPPPAPPAPPGISKIVLHEPRPLKPRNGRKLLSNECCDSMIINDMSMLISAPARIH
ncbi:hypothetical protein BGZ76_010793 [Entomortierella beljakovae]|nr:hypothetical protein BGZ76_010793 [Entomortierella beljakovae]